MEAIPGGGSAQNPLAGPGLLGSCVPVSPFPCLHPNPFLQSKLCVPECSPTSIHTTVTVQSSCSARCCWSWLPKLELPSQSSEQLNPGSIAHPQPSSSCTLAPVKMMSIGFLQQDKMYATFGIHQISPAVSRASRRGPATQS